MADVKIHTTDELKKMSPKDRLSLLRKSEIELVHRRMHLRGGEDKQSHKATALRKMNARIHTFNNQKAA